MILPMLRACRRLLSDRRGISALELVIISAILVPAVLVVVDIGSAAQQQIQLQQALRAGGQVAISGFNTSPSAIKQAVKNALPSNWSDITVATPTCSCSCVNTTTNAASACSTTSSSCSSPGYGCSSAQTQEEFMDLTASSKYTGTFLNTTISASYVVRYQ